MGGYVEEWRKAFANQIEGILSTQYSRVSLFGIVCSG